MLTEKAIWDTVWCPVMWKEEAGNEKRLKPDRNSETGLQKICEALQEGKANNRALIEDISNGYKAVPYDGVFWVVVHGGPTSILTTLTELRLEEGDNGWTCTAVRVPYREPRDDEGKHAEALIRRLTARMIREFLPNVAGVKVETRYKGNPTPYSTENPTEEECLEADDFINEIMAYADGDKRLEAQVEKCPHCWWKECPKRVEPKEVPGTRSGRPGINLL
jgi:hypothetical protein